MYEDGTISPTYHPKTTTMREVPREAQLRRLPPSRIDGGPTASDVGPVPPKPLVPLGATKPSAAKD